MIKLNPLDKMIGYFAPSRAVRRAHARALLSHVTSGRKLEAASKSRRTKNWNASNSSAAGETFGQLQIIRDRSRDLVYNNVFAGRAVSLIASDTVGTGIIGTLEGPKGPLLDKLKVLWKKWSESTDCDSDGMVDFYGMQALAMRSIVESGGVVPRRRWRYVEDGYAVPMQIQLLEPDFIDLAKNEELFQGREQRKPAGIIVQGVEYNLLGKRTAYWLHKTHPAEKKYLSANTEAERVNVSDVSYAFKFDRPGQVHGIPWGAAAFIRLRDFDEFQDATLFKQKIAALFTAVVTKNPNDGMGGVTDDDDEGAIIPEKLDPGGIFELNPGEDIKFSDPPSSENFGDFSLVSLRSISVGFNVPYEYLGNDLSNVNFSSARIGAIPYNRLIDTYRWHMFIPRFCNPVGKWFLEAAAAQFSLSPEVINQFYFDWTAPRKEQMDPETENKAAKNEIRSGFNSLRGVLKERGMDIDTVLKESAEDFKRLDELGLVFDTDPRKISAVGQAQQVGGSPPAGNEANDEG